MKYGVWMAAAVLLVGLNQAMAQSPTPASGDVAHGKYLVENVAGCVDCHTPRTADGKPDMDHYLKGAELGFAPLHPIPHWGKKSPPIAGLKKWTDDQFITFLTTGKDRHGHFADPRMPGYRLSESDARDVLAYLRSLQ